MANYEGIRVDLLEFVAASEWPAVIAAGAAMFRRQIGSFFSRLNSNGQVVLPQLPKASPLIEAAEEMVAERLAGRPSPDSVLDGHCGPWQAAVDAEIELLAATEEYPSEYCVLRTWSSVERLARFQAAIQAKAQGKKYLTLAELSDALKLEAADKALVRHLRDIRYKVAEGELSASQTDACRYRDLILTLLTTLRKPTMAGDKKRPMRPALFTGEESASPQAPR